MSRQPFEAELYLLLNLAARTRAGQAVRWVQGAEARGAGAGALLLGVRTRGEGGISRGALHPDFGEFKFMKRWASTLSAKALLCPFNVLHNMKWPT